MGREHCARDRLFCLLWEHQEFWENEFFREFLKFIKVFELQIQILFQILLQILLQKFCIQGALIHLIAPSLKSEKWCLPDQCLPTEVEFTVYLLFFCFKYNNDWLRIHKQFQMIFGAMLYLIYIICREWP